MQTDRIKTQPFVVCVDFDGVLHRYNKGWHDGSIYDGPMPGASEALKHLMMDLGCQIIIHTTRATDRVVFGQFQPNQLNELKRWLAMNEIPYDVIWTGKGKPLAHLYLDDRAVRFENWNQAFSQILGLFEDSRLTTHDSSKTQQDEQSLHSSSTSEKIQIVQDFERPHIVIAGLF
jgi:hypothetical protein